MLHVMASEWLIKAQYAKIWYATEHTMQLLPPKQFASVGIYLICKFVLVLFFDSRYHLQYLSAGMERTFCE